MDDTSQQRDPRRALDDFELGETIQTATHTVIRRAKLRNVRRSFLIKSLKPGIRPNDAVRRALRRERDALYGMDHPGLATMIETVADGSDDIGLVFLDHRGHRLDVILDRIERLDPLAALSVGIAIGSALGAIHQTGEAHGCLRPEVVEITERGTVVLHGYGELGPAGRGEDDEALMVPENMAPEQLLGDAADPLTDVFQLGTLLYRMMAGRLPFGGDGGSVSQSIRHEAPPPLGGRGRSIPDGVDRVVVRCLRKRRRDRYPDIGSVTSELVHLLGANSSLPSEVLVSRILASAGLADPVPHPLERGPETGTARARQWFQRLAAPITAAVAAAAIAALLWQSLREPPTNDATDPRGIVKRPAQLRILAHPWAEVHIDGKRVDVTPIGRPVEVVPGRHTVVFKHPTAPDETRSVDIIAGQTILLDIEMQVVRPKDAGVPDAAPVTDDDSP
ncbi:MAG: hypothetical protein JRI68_21165 [Deltaproteobacteria bacterium]|nr:hypothetical protein [Deltaproteobacteria bacterium]